jgi:hypothetical protein
MHFTYRITGLNLGGTRCARVEEQAPPGTADSVLLVEQDVLNPIVFDSVQFELLAQVEVESEDQLTRYPVRIPRQTDRHAD